MKKLRWKLWNICDEKCPTLNTTKMDVVQFKVCAVLLWLTGCNYWTNSKDFKGLK